MAQVKVYRSGSVSTTDVDSSLFGERVLGRTLKEAVVMYEANKRAGTAKTKTRAEVAGPNHKLWKQKHTGRARMGTEKAPHWTGGGVAFGPRPRDYSFHMPKNSRRVALRNAVYSKFADGEVCVAEGWPSDAPSTKQAVAVLRALGIERGALVVTAEIDRVLWKSLRNVPQVDVRPLADLNARDVLLRRHMVLTPAALDAMKARLGRSAS
ncbi:MAG: 50S ribosomal protein L4 [Planctomycetota bacterium]